MWEVFGSFVKEPEYKTEYMALSFLPGILSPGRRWRSNSLSADFLGGYLSNFFPKTGKTPGGFDNQREVRHAVSYIANELLENAVKYSIKNTEYSVRLALYLHSDHIRFYLSNPLERKNMEGFRSFIQELLASDPEEMFARSLIRNHADETASTSNLGFLTMLTAYHADLGWAFCECEGEPNACNVITMVKLPILL